MSFAKKYLKEYNADSAWDSLRGGSGAYDYSAVPRQTQNLREAQQEAQALIGESRMLGDLSGAMQAYINDMKRKNRENAYFPTIENFQNELDQFLSSASAFPNYMQGQQLAGRYMQ